MAAGNGWSVVVDGDTPVGAAAVRVLRGRLEAVRGLATDAARPAAGVEVIHRLRVATRRALAALDAFRDLLPRSSRTWLHKRLRGLRRAAGDARDLDVLTGRLEADGGRRARMRLLAMLSRQRDASREPLRRTWEEVAPRWDGHVERLLDRADGQGHGESFAAYARRRFRRRIDRFFGVADRKLRDPDEIHHLRIEVKKLRYAFEIFSGALDPRSRAKCQTGLERLQETLGAYTDHTAAVDRLERLARLDGVHSERTTLERLARSEQRLASAARRTFVRWWDRDRRRSLRRRLERTVRRRPA